MYDAINNLIRILENKKISADEALKFSQSILNLANAEAKFIETKKQ